MEIKIMAPVEGQPLPPIEWNFEAVRQWVEDGLARYEGVVYDDSRIAEAKKDRATLNKLAQAIDSKRRDVKKLYLEPYEAFEVQAKELTGMIKDRVSGIDAQIKDYEAAKKAEKLERIKAECYEPMIGKLAELVPYDRLHEARWLNATCAMATVAAELSEKIVGINAGLSALGGLDLPASVVEQCRATFLKDYNLAAALAEAETLKKQADSLKRWEAEKAAQKPAEAHEAPTHAETPPRAETCASAPQAAQGEQETVHVVDFRVRATTLQLKQLRAAMDEIGVKPERLYL